MMGVRYIGAAVAAALGLSGSAAFAQHGASDGPPSPNAAGEAVFNQTCSGCHKPENEPGGAERAPKLETLRAYPPERILDALVTGKMQPYGALLQDQQRKDVSEWLAGRRLAPPDTSAAAMPNKCPTGQAMGAKAGWNGWGNGLSNSRFQTVAGAGFKASDVPNLKLKWAFGLPGSAQVFSQPTVVGGWLFIGSDSGQVYALDAATGCVHWSYKAEAGVRTAPVVAPLRAGGGPSTVFFGDLRGKMYAIDAATGAAVWSIQIDERPQIRVLDAPAIYRGRLYVGVSSGEEGSLRRPNYECCKFRGSVTAIDSATGAKVWQTYMVDDPAPLPANGPGLRRWGPSGVGIWSTPTVDPKRKRVYVSTGNTYSGPASKLSDSIVALDLTSGKVAWSYQDTANDVWMFGCKSGVPGCADDVGPDYDFSSSSMLKTLADGRDIVVAGHKGGVVVALDPDRRGKLVWRTPIHGAAPTYYGDILFGGSSDKTRAYFALQETAAVVAVDLKSGGKAWSMPLPVITGRAKRVGAGAGVTGMPGVVFSGGWDGVLHAFSTTDGKVVWNFDTMRAFDTVNGVAAKGGSMGGPGPVLADGMLFVGSGYVGVSNGMPGNVLLAFAPQVGK
jgi:polyvinyl alcohol dehydrogenase (cytochrome)